MYLSRKKKSKRSEIGLIYIFPWIMGFFAFSLYPILASLYYAFTNFNLLKRPMFVGLSNFINIFKDQDFYLSLKATCIFVFLGVPAKIVLALLLALLLNTKVRLINFFRTVYYIPSILGGSVAIGILWRTIFMKEGLLNNILSVFSIPPVNWLGNPDTTIYVLTLLPIWQMGSSMVIFLAGLKQIPVQLYESAKIDGISRPQGFFHIIVPMISPLILFNFVMQTINAFQEFSGAFIITNGGPVKSTYLYALYLYDQAFKFFKMGYASAISWILFIIITGMTLIIFKSFSQWVYYEDGGNFQ